MSDQRKARRAVITHTTLAIAWALMLIPTLVWWRDSVLWVAAMSLYANFVGHWSARQGALAEQEANTTSQ